MKRNIMTFEVLFFGLILCSSVLAQIQPRRLIVGGSPIPIESAPHQARIMDGCRLVCGAVIIGPRYLLSAAHCFDNRCTRGHKVVVGSEDIQVLEPCYWISQYYVHPQYRSDAYRNVLHYDIAFLLVDRKFEFCDTVQPIPVATQVPPMHTTVTTTGWGRTSLGCGISRYLMQVHLLVLDTELCNNTYWNRLDESHLCAGMWGEGKDASICYGDSGGPLVADGQLVGITSLHIGCGSTGDPSMFVNVPHVEPWIRSLANQAELSYIFY